MDWLTHHKTSEAYAARAHSALAEGRRVEAEKLFRRAAKAEERALLQLDPAKIRTFGITAVSAVSLWFKGRDLARAARLVQQCLTQPGLLPAARDQLEELRGALAGATPCPPPARSGATSDGSACSFNRWAIA
jgi:hypothetical protein